jgi:integrase
MTHTFAAAPAHRRAHPRASRGPHTKLPLASTFAEKVQITAAMALLHAGVDTSVIALWLGHQDPGSTQAYLHADMTIKEQALSRVAPPNTSPRRYRAPDALLAFLDNI